MNMSRDSMTFDRKKLGTKTKPNPNIKQISFRSSKLLFEVIDKRVKEGGFKDRTKYFRNLIMNDLTLFGYFDEKQEIK